MKKLIILFFILISAGVVFASFASETKERAEKICTSLNMDYLSHEEDQNSIFFITYLVKCSKDSSAKNFILRYDKILGTWSQHNFIR